MRECGCGCWTSVLTSHHSTEVESNVVNVLLAIIALLFACHLPLPCCIEMDLLNQQNKSC